MYCDLVRRAAVQVGAPREQLRAFAVFQASVVRELGEAELHIVERQIADGAVVEMLERLRGALRLLAAHGELRAAARDGDVERRLDLAQILVERAAQAREALVVDRVEPDLDAACAQASCDRARRAASAAGAAVMRTSTKRLDELRRARGN